MVRDTLPWIKTKSVGCNQSVLLIGKEAQYLNWGGWIRSRFCINTFYWIAFLFPVVYVYWIGWILFHGIGSRPFTECEFSQRREFLISDHGLSFIRSYPWVQSNVEHMFCKMASSRLCIGLFIISSAFKLSEILWSKRSS